MFTSILEPFKQVQPIKGPHEHFYEVTSVRGLYNRREYESFYVFVCNYFKQISRRFCLWSFIADIRCDSAVQSRTFPRGVGVPPGDRVTTSKLLRFAVQAAVEETRPQNSGTPLTGANFARWEDIKGGTEKLHWYKRFYRTYGGGSGGGDARTWCLY